MEATRANAKLQEAVDRLVAAAAGMPGLPHMMLMQEAFAFLLNDCRIIKPQNVKRGIPINFDDARTFVAKRDELVNRIGDVLMTYEAEHGVDLSK
jgi:hypothetical protein